MVVNVLILLGASLGVIYVGLMVFAKVASDPMIFPAPPASYESDLPDTKIETSDGNRLAVRFIRNPEARFTLLYSHGNGEDLGTVEDILELYAKLGFQVIGWDYPGYGLSSGKPTEAGCYAGIEAVYQWALKQPGVQPENVLVYGRSLGSGPSLYLAEHHPLAGVILEGAFTSTFRVMTHVQIVPFDKFDNLARLPAVSEPLLVIHGERDQTIPVWHGRKLFDRAINPQGSLFIPEAGHNDLLEVAPEAVFAALQNFADYLTPTQSPEPNGD